MRDAHSPEWRPAGLPNSNAAVFVRDDDLTHK